MKSFKQFINEDQQVFKTNTSTGQVFATGETKPNSPPKPKNTFSDKAVSIYPHGQGSDVGDNVPTSKPTTIPTKSASGNEPFKDKSFFNRPEKKDYMDKMSSDIKKGKKMPPVMSTPNPANPKHNIVVDGNHRMDAHKQAGVSHIPTQHVDHDNIHLASHNYEHPDQTFHKLSSFKEPDGSYDMNKSRKQLGGKKLNHYFVKPDGSHEFKSPFEK